MKNEAFRKRIGKNLQKARKEAGFKSARLFAESLGMEAGTYTAYEQGSNAFTYELAWQFADALGCTLDALGGRTPPQGQEYADPMQGALNGFYESMNSQGRSALVESARLMSGSPDTRIEKDGAEDLPLPAPVERIA